MGRGKIRECIRRAQTAELAGALDEAVRNLEDAARLHLLRNEESRAAVLLRHGLRLRPDRKESLELLARVQSAGGEQPDLPDEPIQVVEVPDAASAAAPPPRGPSEDPIKVVELPDAEPAGSLAGRGLEIPPRGPVLADPAADCWCSFCCRPRSEAGPMVAGPAGAYICSKCLGTSAGLLGAPSPDPERYQAPDPKPTEPPAPSESLGFIEAAVVLSKKLGWGLSELRALSPEELSRALKKLEELGDGR